MQRSRAKEKSRDAELAFTAWQSPINPQTLQKATEENGGCKQIRTLPPLRDQKGDRLPLAARDRVRFLPWNGGESQHTHPTRGTRTGTRADSRPADAASASASLFGPASRSSFFFFFSFQGAGTSWKKRKQGFSIGGHLSSSSRCAKRRHTLICPLKGSVGGGMYASPENDAMNPVASRSERERFLPEDAMGCSSWGPSRAS